MRAADGVCGSPGGPKGRGCAAGRVAAPAGTCQQRRGRPAHQGARAAARLARVAAAAPHHLAVVRVAGPAAERRGASSARPPRGAPGTGMCVWCAWMDEWVDRSMAPCVLACVNHHQRRRHLALLPQTSQYTTLMSWPAETPHALALWIMSC